MNQYFDINRRRFIKLSVSTSASLMIGASLLGDTTRAATSVLDNKSSDVKTANLFVGVRPDGVVEITCHRSEMGQHIRTAIAQIIADEMEADWNMITVIQAKGDPRYGDQNTDGSQSIRINMKRLREAGASVRFMFEQAAAKQWHVEPSSCKAQLHTVIHASGKVLQYKELIASALLITPPPAEQLKLKPRADWRYMNKAIDHVDLHAIITGTAQYAADVRLPGTKVAVIVRPPVLGGTVKMFNDNATRKLSGVIDVIKIPPAKGAPGFQPKGGIAVIADNTWAAIQGSKLLEITWDDGANAAYNSDEFKATLINTVQSPQIHVREKGDAYSTLSNATNVLSADYYMPHLNQAPIETPCSTAMYYPDHVDVWSSTQHSQRDMEVVGAMVGLDKSKVNVNVTLIGGAFGRKSKPDFSAEAAFISMKTGVPIRVQWTREDDIQHGYYHAASAQHIEASIQANGTIDAYLHRTAFTPIASIFIEGTPPPFSSELGLGFTDNPINTPNMKLESGLVKAMTRIGWMRSVSNNFHAFAVQSFIDEAANKAGQDSKDYLLTTIGPDRVIDVDKEKADYFNYGGDKLQYPLDTSRLKQVIESVSQSSKWGRKLSPRRGLGIAAHRSFLTYVAIVVEVEVSDNGDLDVIECWVSIDAGTIINRDTVVNQTQGGAIFGLSSAISHGITFKNGRVEQSNFHDYTVARMQDSPLDINVTIIDSEEPPAGVGEPATPVFAPALCNAIFAATGKRIRHLPIGEQLKNEQLTSGQSKDNQLKTAAFQDSNLQYAGFQDTNFQDTHFQGNSSQGVRS